MIALVDYGIGNLRSVYKALVAVGVKVCLTSEADDILTMEKVVLPGVGAFADGMHGLRQRGLEETIKTVVNRGTPLLGICLGMQLLFDGSEEMGKHAGLSLLPGYVHRLPGENLKIPQTGWNQIVIQKDHPLLDGLPSGSYAYFNHSYYCLAKQTADVVAITNYGLTYASVIAHDSLYGVQFHPEKSQSIGLKILKNFIERC